MEEQQTLGDLLLKQIDSTFTQIRRDFPNGEVRIDDAAIFLAQAIKQPRQLVYQLLLGLERNRKIKLVKTGPAPHCKVFPADAKVPRLRHSITNRRGDEQSGRISLARGQQSLSIKQPKAPVAEPSAPEEDAELAKLREQIAALRTQMEHDDGRRRRLEETLELERNKRVSADEKRQQAEQAESEARAALNRFKAEAAERVRAMEALRLQAERVPTLEAEVTKLRQMLEQQPYVPDALASRVSAALNGVTPGGLA